MKIEKYFTKGQTSPYQDLTFETRGPVTVPSGWSQVATDVLAQKYLRRTDVPGTGGETDARQVFHRLAQTWRTHGERFGYFSKDDAAHFYDEICYMLSHQIAAPNSPQWFNTGLYEVYAIPGTPQGHWYVDEDGTAKLSPNAYQRPQVHACFIQSLSDSLVGAGGIFDLWQREARIFKYGAGTGTNFSRLRAEGEPLSGGGRSSGLMSFLKIGDTAAGAIRSGGTTRRAAKMVCLDIDHPEIEAFIDWKIAEEHKVAYLVTGSEKLREAFRKMVDDAKMSGTVSESTIAANARTLGLPQSYVRKVLVSVLQNQVSLPEVLDIDWRGQAYQTVSGQNSNNSVRIPNEFFETLDAKKPWTLRSRTDGFPAKQVDTESLWHRVAFAAWSCADPGVQFHTTINEWHTCPAGGEIVASNPCSEYLFLNDTGCNLASLNLLRFYDEKTREFRIEQFRHAIRLWTIVLEISVRMAQYPSAEIAVNSAAYRTLGLGFANLGALLMTMGLPYDSEEARAVAGGITALMSGEAFAVSAEMAKELGPFAKYSQNRDAMLRVLKNHRAALTGGNFEGLRVKPQIVDPKKCPPAILAAAKQAWESATALGEKHGLRNAQVTAIAPTGTIGLLMDCDTLGVEPEFSLIKTKTLAGGGSFRIVNQSVRAALMALGYSAAESTKLVDYCNANGSLEGAPELKPEHVAVFDCAQAKTSSGRTIGFLGHIEMAAAVQPFISGGISKTINLPANATVDDVKSAYRTSWEKMLKSVSLYRDGSKLSQPLVAEFGQDENAAPICFDCA